MGRGRRSPGTCRGSGLGGVQDQTRAGRDLLADLHAAGLLPPWATGDEVYGRDKTLRGFCEQHGVGYVFGVPCSFGVVLTSGRRVRADQALKLVPPTGWNHASCGAGSKGDRAYGWAWIGTDSDRHHLLVRRNLTDPTDVAFFTAMCPAGGPLRFPSWSRSPGADGRWRKISRSAKDQLGLDHSQVRLYTALLRHIVLTMIALAVCAVTAAATRTVTNTAAPPPPHPDDEAPADPGLIPLTVAEVKRLSNMLTRTGQRLAHHRNRLRRNLQPVQTSPRLTAVPAA